MAAMVRIRRSDSEYLLWMLCMMYHMAQAAPRHPRPAPPSPAPDSGRGRERLGRAKPQESLEVELRLFRRNPERLWGRRAAAGAFPEQRRSLATQNAETPPPGSDVTPSTPPRPPAPARPLVPPPPFLSANPQHQPPLSRAP